MKFNLYFVQRLTITADGEKMGSITQNWNAWRPSFTIRDREEVPVLHMKGPICLGCRGEVDFEVYL